MFKFSSLIRSAIALVALAALAVGATACASEEHGTVVEGEPIHKGDLEYKVVFTRLLNIHDVEDRAYLEGAQPPSPGHYLLGVFLTVENLSKDDSVRIPDGFEVVDTDGHSFKPLELDNLYSLRLGDEVGPSDFVPAIDSPAQVGPISGSMLLFEIPDEATVNQPLELVIPGDGEESRVILDI